MQREQIFDILNRIDSKYSKRYVNFIKKYIHYTGPGELHHIIPVCIDPKLEKKKSNIINLPHRAHFISHWMLSKIYGGKCWFAFNMMRRVGKNSILYKYARMHIQDMLEDLNKNREKTHENRRNISQRTKNTVVVRDNTGEMFRIHKDDPRYISGELISYRVGYKHSAETRKKISNSNKGKEVTVTEEARKKLSKTFANLIWVTEKNTGIHRRIPIDRYDDSVYDRGRIGYPGWRIVNERRKYTIR